MSATDQPTIEQSKLAQETLASYGIYAPLGQSWDLLQEKGLDLIEPEQPSDPAFLGDEQSDEERQFAAAQARMRQSGVVSATTSTTETSYGTTARSMGDEDAAGGKDALGNPFVGPGEVQAPANRPRPARAAKPEQAKPEE